jgi:hypothetical protein
MKKLGLLMLLCMVILPLQSCQTGPSQKSDPDPRIVEQAASPVTDVQTDMAQDYSAGNSGAGQSLTILAPKPINLNSGEAYLPNFVQGIITDDFKKFSKIETKDWQSLEKVLAETERLVYAENNDIIAAGNITQTQYILTGEIIKTGAGYALQFRITDTKTGINKASYSGSCSKEQLDKMSGVKAASADLLAQMGVNLTAQEKTTLLAVTDNTAEAQTALAKGVTASRTGTVVEALSYYLTSVNYDPSSAEAASRLNVLSTNISSGNIGDDVRNDIQWRKDWIARLTEAEQYFANQTKDPAPYYLTYSMNVQQGRIDYAKETVSISGLSMNLFPNNEAWFAVPVQVVNTVRDGFMKTGRASEWGLNWPRSSVSNSSAFQSRYERIVASVELLNDKGTVIGKQDVSLQGGWGLDTYNGFKLSFRSDKQQAVFYSVNANLITDKLNIRIASIDGVNTNTAAKNKRISIMTVDEYEKLEWERQAPERARQAAIAEQVRAREAELERIRQPEIKKQKTRKILSPIIVVLSVLGTLFGVLIITSFL